VRFGDPGRVRYRSGRDRFHVDAAKRGERGPARWAIPGHGERGLGRLSDAPLELGQLRVHQRRHPQEHPDRRRVAGQRQPFVQPLQRRKIPADDRIDNRPGRTVEKILELGKFSLRQGARM
jgi:hypothetical protein